MALKKEEIIIIGPEEIFVGRKDAPVTLTEFGEYESEECARVNEVVKQLLEDYEGKIRFQFRHFPLTMIHQRSLKASESAVGAAQEGKFWEMHNILFANRRQLGTISLKRYAREIGITDKRFLDMLVNSTYSWQVRDDLLEGLQKGVRDVPAFFINGEKFLPEPTLQNLKKFFDELLKAKGIRTPAKAH